MQNSTFHNLKRAYLNDIDSDVLKQLRLNEIPLVKFQIDMILNREVDKSRIKAASFTNANEISKRSLDEAVIYYILFIANIVKYDKYHRTFLRPGSWLGECAWIQMLKLITYCIVTLIYNVKWNSNYFFQLDCMISELLQGKALALRTFFEKINIKNFTKTTFPIERDVEMLQFQNVDDFGPYYWRLLHWMAQAIEIRHGHDDIQLAKSLWQEFVTSTMYRTLRCIRCMNHYMNIAYRFKERLSTLSNYPKLWYEIHNEVRASQQKLVYPLKSFDQDSESMKSVLQQ